MYWDGHKGCCGEDLKEGSISKGTVTEFLDKLLKDRGFS